MIEQAVKEQAQVLKMRQDIQAQLTPENRAALFLREFRRTAGANGLTETVRTLNRPQLASLNGSLVAAYGTIKGEATFTAGGTPNHLSVLAFDKNGYFARINNVGYYDWWDSTYVYEIDSLLPGEYYLVTVTGEYANVDQIYDGVDAPLLSLDAWRAARTVVLPAGGTRDSINFRLRGAAQFSVRLYRADGVSLLSESDLTFTLTRYNSPEILIRQEYEFDDSDSTYTLYLPLLGDFKLGVGMPGSFSAMAWYRSSGTWEGADKISVTGLADPVKKLGFVTGSAGAADLGKISGYVSANGEIMIIAAFKASDLSLGGVTLALGTGSFTIEEVPAGDYIVYADDYLGNMQPGGDGLGTFYQSAGTPAGAQIVHVNAGQTTSGIFITLRKGATIAGRVTDESGNPIDSMIVATVSMDVGEATAYGLLTHFSPGVAGTDSMGYYRIRGLAPGNYMVRTASAYFMKLFWGFPMVGDGPQKGLFVDEFYPDLYNIYDIGRARKITVQDTMTVAGIDFRLQRARYVQGKLFESGTNTPVTQARVRAHVDSTGGPFSASSKVDAQGAYKLGPLPSGKYRILAVNDNPDKDSYMVEYYNNVRTNAEAATIEVKDADVTGIDFGFDKGAVIRGSIDLSQGASPYPAGEDTVVDFPVVLLNAVDGSVVRLAWVQFNGGFRFPQVVPGSYKLLALPMNSPFAATYYGGGTQFNDPQSLTLQLTAGQVLDVSLKLQMAGGSIKGTVKDKKTGAPVPNCLVVAYDPTGHAAGLAMTDSAYTTVVNRPATGAFQITGLKAGTYRLRTFAMIDEAPVLRPIVLGPVLHTDPLTMALSVAFAMMQSDGASYNDAWYGDVPIPTRVDIPGMAATVLMYGVPDERDHARIPLFMPLPLVQQPPAGAAPVTVTENGTVQNINFALAAGNFSDVFSDIPDRKDVLPVTAYALFQNYPNPFNPATVIRYAVPRRSHVTLTVFNSVGQKVAELVNGEIAAGHHEIRFTAENLASGVYFYRLRSGTFVQTKSFVVLR